MKRVAVLLMCVAVAIGLIGASAFCQEDMVEVNSSMFAAPQRAPSVFRHDEHNETAAIADCNVCHHVYDDTGKLLETESSEGQPCADCHDLKDKGRQPGLMKAFHLNCKGCHQKEAKGPVMCGECHRRK
jgi:hypothetical protein